MRAYSRAAFAVLTVTSIVMAFQNCSSGLEGAPSGISSSSLFPSPDPTPGPSPNPSPGPAPTPMPQPDPLAGQRIPSQAVLDVVPIASANPFCPTGYDRYLLGCIRTFKGESNPMVLTEIAASVAGACTPGFVLKPVGQYSNGSVINGCMKFQPANQALNGFITNQRTTDANSQCANWEVTVPLNEPVGYKICHFKYSGLGRPHKAISTIYLPAENVGCNAGDQLLHRFRAYGGALAVGSSVICLGYASTNDPTAMLVSEVETPAENQACSAGFMKLGDMFNSHLPARKWPLCAKFALAPNVALPYVSFYLSHQTPNFQTIIKVACKTGDFSRGESPVFKAGPGSDFYWGQSNFCSIH